MVPSCVFVLRAPHIHLKCGTFFWDMCSYLSLSVLIMFLYRIWRTILGFGKSFLSYIQMCSGVCVCACPLPVCILYLYFAWRNVLFEYWAYVCVHIPYTIPIIFLSFFLSLSVCLQFEILEAPCIEKVFHFISLVIILDTVGLFSRNKQQQFKPIDALSHFFLHDTIAHVTVVLYLAPEHPNTNTKANVKYHCFRMVFIRAWIIWLIGLLLCFFFCFFFFADHHHRRCRRLLSSLLYNLSQRQHRVWVQTIYFILYRMKKLNVCKLLMFTCMWACFF